LLPLVASLAAFAAPPPATALVQVGRAATQIAAPLLRSVGGDQIAPELRIWRVPQKAVGRLRRAGVVAFAEPERMLSTAANAPSDPLVQQQWWRSAIGADRADPPGPGKPVTVVDSGLDMSHPEFANRPNTTLLNTQTIRSEDDDHGTEVSSVIGAPINGVGLVGVYPLADLRSWDASPNGFLSDGSAIQGILEAAKRGPGVINLSFGGPINDPLLEEAVLMAVRSGSLVVAASGNEGGRSTSDNFPASYPHVLTIAATDQDNLVARFSTASPWVDLAAPGVSIPVAEPTSRESTGYIRASGTSFSAPLVAGAAAWVWTARPDLDSTQLFEVMRRSARDIGARGVDDASGFGLLDIPAALATAPPAKDPYEPNDDGNQIEPRRVFNTGTPPLTTAKRGSASLSARIDRREDPHDFYRVYAPSHRRVTVTTSGGAVDLRLFRRSSRPLRRPALATSAKAGSGAQRVSYRNPRSSAVYVYAEIRPGRGVASATYALEVTTSARR
jgi:Subtilase family